MKKFTKKLTTLALLATMGACTSGVNPCAFAMKDAPKAEESQDVILDKDSLTEENETPATDAAPELRQRIYRYTEPMDAEMQRPDAETRRHEDTRLRSVNIFACLYMFIMGALFIWGDLTHPYEMYKIFKILHLN